MAVTDNQTNVVKQLSTVCPKASNICLEILFPFQISKYPRHKYPIIPSVDQDNHFEKGLALQSVSVVIALTSAHSSYLMTIANWNE